MSESKFLNDIYDNRDKPISESSRKLYSRNLSKLNNDQEINNLNFLNTPKDILNKVKDYKPTTQRSYIIAICTVLKNDPKLEPLYNQYYEILTKMNGDLKVRTDKSETQEANWMSKNEIDNVLNNLALKVVKKAKNKDDYNKILDYLILSLYTMHAPRRNIDYTLMKISNDISDKSFNYLDLKGVQFIFNNYKTQGTYESVVVPIREDLFQVISIYMNNHPEKAKLKNKKYNIHFLVNYHGEPINKSIDMTRYLNRLFNGKKVGSSMLRNMYLTNKYGDMMGELKNDVLDMSTSIGTAMDNYIKQD
jgi:hypothetical protein